MLRLIFLVSACFQILSSASQVDTFGLLHIPVYQMERQGPYCREGTTNLTALYDSINDISTSISVHAFDKQNDCVPHKYTMRKLQEIPATFYKFVALSCKDSSFKYESLVSLGTSIWPNDSLFLSENDSVKMDTIYTEHVDFEKLFSFGLCQILWTCDYHYGLKHGTEIGYYNYLESTGYCIARTALVKYKGNWKNGEKVGKWVYYDQSGELVRCEIFRSGLMVRVK